MFRTLLVPLDRSSLAEEALGPAAAIARASNANVDLVLVHQPIPYAGFQDVPWSVPLANAEEKYLETISSELTIGADVPVSHALPRGDVIQRITDRAKEVDADLIVMTTHGRTGMSRVWLGSITDGVLRHSPIPVLMMRPVGTKKDRLAAHRLFGRILVPIDGSAASMEILPVAADLARCSNARLILLRVVQPVPLVIPDYAVSFIYPSSIRDEDSTKMVREDAEREVKDAVLKLADMKFTDVETHVVVADHVAQTMIDFAHANSVDAIAMSTHGRGASRLFVGSVADKMLRASGLPILLRRPVLVGTGIDHVSAESIEEQLPALAGH